MPAAIGSKAFDPAAHLEKQGWKGKGTALKNGHLTRPLAVVHKKCLGGVGKNRDEQVPFWDNIFAATAASLSLPSSLPSSGTSTLTSTTHRLADPRINKLGSWQTSGSAEASSSHTNKGKGQAGLSIATRVAQENARRGLYSRFFRGEVMRCGGEEEEGETTVVQASSTISTAVPMTLTSTSTSTSTSPPATTSDPTPDRKETKEERRARRAAKIAQKAEKEARKAERVARKEAKAKRKADHEASRAVGNDDTTDADVRVDGQQAMGEGQAAVGEDEEQRRARKKRRKEEKRAKEATS